MTRSFIAALAIVLEACNPGSSGTTSTGEATATSGGLSTSGGSVGSSTGSTSSGAGSSSGTASASGTSTGAALSGHESWVWIYVDFPASLGAISANPTSFTHVSPFLYSVNYSYRSGVAYYSNCGGTSSCTDPGTDNFGGLTSMEIASQINALGLATVPTIYGGGMAGVDLGIANILDNSAGEQTSFITSMVDEAVTKGYSGYVLDFEVDEIDGTYATKFVSFVNAFKEALASHGMSLSAVAIPQNIDGTLCSGNGSGYFDFGLISDSEIDRVILDDFDSSYGTASSSCQSVVLSTTNPAACPTNSAMTAITFTGLLNFACTNLPSRMVVVGLYSNSRGTNSFAGQAISTLEAYGIDKVAVWPEQEGTTPLLSSQGLVAPQATWYALLASFLKT